MGRKSLAHKRKPESLEHFYKVIIKEGLQGTSIAKIANHMGVNPSLLTHYFHSKEEMVIELLEVFFKKYNQAFMVKIQKTHDPEKRFDALLDTFFGVEWELGYHGCSIRILFGFIYQFSEIRRRKPNGMPEMYLNDSLAWRNCLIS